MQNNEFVAIKSALQLIRKRKQIDEAKEFLNKLKKIVLKIKNEIVEPWEVWGEGEIVIYFHFKSPPGSTLKVITWKEKENRFFYQGRMLSPQYDRKIILELRQLPICKIIVMKGSRTLKVIS